MTRLALCLAFGAMVAAGLPSPGLYLAIGLGIGAVGLGSCAFRTRHASGAARLAGAAAMAVGVLGCLLGAVRVAIALAALAHVDHMLG